MWYYVENGEQKGPFEEAQLEALIAARTVTPSTLVWQAGQANWMPLSQARGANANTCQICNQPAGADNLIELNGVRVCATCKPVALQSMREGIGIGGDRVWVDGKKIVTTDGATFPPRCVKCNAPTSGEPLKRKLYWHEPWLYFLILAGILVRLGLLIYIIAAVIMRKRATVHMHLCPKHRQQRLIALIFRWAAIPVMAILVATAIALKNPWIGVAAGGVLIAAVVGGLVFARLTRTSRIDKDKTVWLSGAGKDFRASLPPWTGK